MKKVVKFICLLIIAGLIAILVLRNGANAEGGHITLSATNTTPSVGDNITVTLKFPQKVTSFSGTIESSNESVLGRSGSTAIGYGLDDLKPGQDTFTFSFHAESAGSANINVTIDQSKFENSPEGLTDSASLPITVGSVSVPAPVLAVDHSSIVAGNNATISVTNDVDVTWSVSGNIQEVSHTNRSIVVTGTTEGTGNVTATSQGGSASQGITVSAQTPPSGNAPVLSIGNSSLAVGGDPTTATSDKPVTWGSTNTQVATVSADQNSTQATVIPIGPGVCEIVGSCGDGESRISVTVAEAPAPEPEVSAPRIYPSSNVKIYVGQSAALDSDQSVTWSSSDSSVVSVSSDGDIEGKAEGSATVTAKSKSTGKTTTKAITVVAAAGGNTDSGNSTNTDTSTDTPSPAATIAISPSKKQSIKIGETIQFKVTKGSATSWESSKTDVASVDNNGTVKGLKAGTTVISAIASDGSIAQVRVAVGSADENATNSTSTTNEVVPATGEAPTQLLVVIGAITFIVAVAIFRKKTK